MENCTWPQSSNSPWAPENNVADLKLGNYGEARINDLLNGPKHVSEVKEANRKGLCVCADSQLWIQRHWILWIKELFSILLLACSPQRWEIQESREIQNNKQINEIILVVDYMQINCLAAQIRKNWPCLISNWPRKLGLFGTTSLNFSRTVNL